MLFGQIFFILIYILINLGFYWLAFPGWAYPGFAIFIFLSHLFYLHIYLALRKNEMEVEYPIVSHHYIKELETAQKVQQGLLAIDTPSIPGIKIARHCVPAKSIGGDFYVFFGKKAQMLHKREKQIPGVIEYVDDTSNYLAAIIGDVAGHGVSSALVMALSSGLLSEIAKTHIDPAKTLEIANKELLKYIENSQISHVTAFYSLINIKSKIMSYAKAGHEPAIVIHKDNTSELLSSDGVFLGLFPEELYEKKEIQLRAGDRLILYTDGIIEARNEQQEEYSLERLINFLKTHANFDIYELLNLIFADVQRFAGNVEIADDQTLVILEIE